MTHSLVPPPRENPQSRTVSPTVPPAMRSRAALHLTAAAAEGRLELQRCEACGEWQYPPRDACRSCLCEGLVWTDLPQGGLLLAETRIDSSPLLFFRERLPWRIGTVQSDAGPTVLAHVHPDVARHGRVWLTAHLDRAGQGVLVAMPPEPTPNMEDALLMRALTADPKHRRVLISDGRSPLAVPLVRAFREAGAAIVFVGESESWRGNPQQEELIAHGAEVLPLDVTDTKSVRTLAAEIGGKVDILVNTARFMRPGGAIARRDTGFARDEIETNYLGLMRLAQAFGPGMAQRTADGVNAAVAWVNLFHIGALANTPGYGAFSASQAAALSLSQSLRAEFRGSGLRVVNAFTGPLDDDWFQPLPPPKVAPNAVARAVVTGLQRGVEDLWIGDVAQDVRDRFRRDPRVLERELTLGGDAP